MKDVNKTVKHCEVCQENFGDRFSFCPVCGEPLKAVEVGQNEAFAAAPTRENAQIQSEQMAAATPVPVIESAPQFIRQPTVASTNGASKFQDNRNNPPAEEHISNEPVAETDDFEQPLAEPSFAQPVIEYPAFEQAPRYRSNAATAGDGLYHLTMLQTPPTYRRYLGYGAMLGLFLLLTGGFVMMIIGIYSYNLDIGSAEYADVLYLPDDGNPVAEIKDPPKKNDKKGGGGGGGGDENPKPASRGVDVAQMRAEPVIKPTVTIHQADFELKQTPTTVGDKPKKEDGPPGIHSSTSDDPSNGPGRGGGQGTGIGGGQGSGNGTGKGSGTGSGSGGGNGDGNGNGRGVGSGEDAPPAPKVAAVTERLNIISKPRANYTEEARKNQISGTVRVRVTFSSSGQVTGVTAIGGLPYGLTEQAIAAARQIKFTPEKHGGQPVSVNKVIEYNFNLY